MAKGKTNQPIVIMVPTPWLERPEIKALAEQGHKVVEGNLAEYDLILGPQCHMFNDMMLDYLPAAIAGARKRKREAKTK